MLKFDVISFKPEKNENRKWCKIFGVQYKNELVNVSAKRTTIEKIEDPSQYDKELVSLRTYTAKANFSSKLHTFALNLY